LTFVADHRRATERVGPESQIVIRRERHLVDRADAGRAEVQQGSWLDRWKRLFDQTLDRSGADDRSN
jgi:hypothetical protein